MKNPTTLAVTAATVYGLLLRILHDLLDPFLGNIISISFLILAPVTIGFLTIYLLPKEHTKSLSGAIFKPFLPCFILMCVTIALNIEGKICWLMIFPLFAFTASLGGILAYQIKKVSNSDSNHKTKKNRNTLHGSFILFLPLVVGFIEGDSTLSRKDFYISKSVTIQAPTNEVWKELTNINEIKPEEQKFNLSTFLGFPKHISTTIEKMEVGGRRIALYEKGLYFNETISKFENEKRLVLNIDIDPTTIPVTVMDEHIVLGGKYVDILQDVYSLESLPDGTSKLTLSSRFYINTPFNWYAGIWSEYLMGDILKSQINLIRSRTQKTNDKGDSR
ncbi:SRPBCC family protein [Leptospira kanakyensis]|uniref:SRPBCC family protein n=1 Tax=Leptospira kanakyensis TaxID=2484968 RepID=A0A6N4PZM6_9LEPT|nr:hypothetical protein [Leptospira kanakyensis]MCW7480255.1 hypothetical protein [Leptospira kanakyensis]TGK50451.1 hypothetical protein EHQ11_12245 [Leptospira kanakyensis]TGK63948.1 hypothetical protein EHQ16_05775 [Leptospira kanakyensis]TGK69589.1 hypothetical protein EHQ18_12405 [Leptospira kanakyensis]